MPILSPRSSPKEQTTQWKRTQTILTDNEPKEKLSFAQSEGDDRKLELKTQILEHLQTERERLPESGLNEFEYQSPRQPTTEKLKTMSPRTTQTQAKVQQLLQSPRNVKQLAPIENIEADQKKEKEEKEERESIPEQFFSIPFPSLILF